MISRILTMIPGLGHSEVVIIYPDYMIERIDTLRPLVLASFLKSKISWLAAVSELKSATWVPMMSEGGP